MSEENIRRKLLSARLSRVWEDRTPHEGARAAIDPTIESVHLDLASRHATLSKLAARTDSKDGPAAMPPMQVAVGR